MKKLFLFSTGILSVLFAFSARADDGFLQDEIEQIRNDLQILQRQVYREQSDLSAPKESVSNVQVRLGEYDQIIRDLTGKVENVEYRIKTLEQKVEAINKDIDLRFEQMGRKIAIQQDAAAKKTSAPAAKKAAPKTTEKKKPAATANKENNVSSKKLYETALADLKSEKLDAAEKKLNQYLESYPKEDLAGNAQYWLGEIYYKQQKYAKAAVAFKNGYSNYPNGSKGPDCLLKLGLSMKALGKKDEACTAFVNLPTVFDKVSSAISERAQKEAKALECK